MIISRSNALLVVPIFVCLITWIFIEMSFFSGFILFIAQLLLFFSVILLIWEGSDILVKSSQEIAEHFNVSPFLIGLTIVAFGTSIPEMVTSLVAGFSGKGDIAVANIIGSNILNIAVILGGLAMLTKGGLAINRQVIRLDSPMLILGTLLILLFLGKPFISTNIFDKINHFGFLNLKLDIFEAVVLTAGFIIYLFVIITKRGDGEECQVQQEPKENNLNKKKQKTLLSKFVGVIAGLAIVMIGCHLLVGNAEMVEGVTRGYGAVWFATVFGIPDFIIGLSIVALGTSAPEIVVSLSAARSNSIEIGVGNLLGSAIFNIFAVLGVVGLFVQFPLAEPISINTCAVQSLIAMGLLFILVFIFLSTGKRLSRKEGLILFCTGIAYMIYEIVNTMPQNIT